MTRKLVTSVNSLFSEVCMYVCVTSFDRFAVCSVMWSLERCHPDVVTNHTSVATVTIPARLSSLGQYSGTNARIATRVSY